MSHRLLHHQLELAPVLTSSGPPLTPSTPSSAPAGMPSSTPLRSHPHQQDRDLSPLTFALPLLQRRTTMSLGSMKMLSRRQIRTGRIGFNSDSSTALAVLRTEKSAPPVSTPNPPARGAYEADQVPKTRSRSLRMCY